MTRELRLHQFATFTAFCTFFLIIFGGLVTSTGSGLAVPDWPLSYGQVMPPMVGGIFYEHGHRMIATFVGLLTVILAVWLWKVDDRRWVRILGIVAVGAVIVQGVLGGMTVLFLLPIWLSLLHGTVAQSFFALTVFLALVTSKGWREMEPLESTTGSRTRTLAVVAIGVVLLQLVLGAWMRHSNAGLAIPDFPLSYGAVVPSVDEAALADINPARIEAGLAPVEARQVWIHYAHRIGALLVLIVVLGLVRHILTTYREEQRLREPALLLGAAVIVQALLGALTVWTGKGVEIATTHQAFGALVLGLTGFVAARAFRLFPVPVRQRGFSPLPSPTRP